MPIFKQPPPKVPHKPGPVIYDRTPGSMSIPKPPRPPYPGPIQTTAAGPVNLGAIMRYGQAQGQYPQSFAPGPQAATGYREVAPPPPVAMPATAQNFQAVPQAPAQGNFQAAQPRPAPVASNFQAAPGGEAVMGGGSFAVPRGNVVQPPRPQPFRRY